MNEQEKTMKLVELSGLPIYHETLETIARGHYQYPCLVFDEDNFCRMHHSLTGFVSFRPLESLDHAWLVARSWCDRNKCLLFLSYLDGETKAAIRRRWAALPNDLSIEVQNDNEAAAVSEAVLLAEKARVNE